MRVLTARDELFLSTVRIHTGDSVATGSLVTYDRPDTEPAPFIVTNAHVVENKRSANVFFLQADNDGRPLLGSPYIFTSQNFEALWHHHPNPAIDVAVAPFAPVEQDLDARRIAIANPWISLEYALPEEPFRPEIDEHPWLQLLGVAIDAIEEVLFIGYPSGYYDTQNHLPIARRGSTATPVSVNYGGEPVFLVDAPILPGSSGSPVFIVDSHSLRQRTGRGGNERFIFLGVVTEFLPFKQPGKPPRAVTNEEDRLRLLTGLGLVYKPSTIRETIESCLAAQQTGA